VVSLPRQLPSHSSLDEMAQALGEVKGRGRSPGEMERGEGVDRRGVDVGAKG
jgi:hypothetical protein